MKKPVKLILVTANHHPLHETWIKLASEISKKVKLKLEIKEEDYILLSQYGDKDEFGMPWLPQLLVQYEGGETRVVISQLPLDKDLKPDLNKAFQLVLEKLERGA